MTLKELFDRCDFKEIAQVIKENYPQEEAQMTHFKEAFDVIRHLEPKLNLEYPSYQKVTLSPVPYNDWEKKGKKKDFYISATGGDCWESDLAKEIVVSEELIIRNI